MEHYGEDKRLNVVGKKEMRGKRHMKSEGKKDIVKERGNKDRGKVKRNKERRKVRGK